MNSIEFIYATEALSDDDVQVKMKIVVLCTIVY